eukprot:888447-Pyramimonas_sp.AAC.2
MFRRTQSWNHGPGQLARCSTHGMGLERQNRTASIAVKPHESLLGFFRGRTINESLSGEILKSDNNLVQHRESEDVGGGLRGARQDAWTHGKHVEKALGRAISRGPKWMRKDIRRACGPPVAPQYKSRLVV